MVFCVFTGKRKCADILLEGFYLEGKEILLSNFTKIIYANSVSKNVMVWQLHCQSVELIYFCEPIKIYGPKRFLQIKTITDNQ